MKKRTEKTRPSHSLDWQYQITLSGNYPYPVGEKSQLIIQNGRPSD